MLATGQPPRRCATDHQTEFVAVGSAITSDPAFCSRAAERAPGIEAAQMVKLGTGTMPAEQ